MSPYGGCMKRIVSLALLALIIIAQTGCGENTKEQVSDSRFYLDTECTVTLYDIEEKRGKELIGKAFELCSEYEGLLSKTIEESDIYRINHAEGRQVKVDKETAEVVRLGLEMGKESDGKFDITVGRLTDLWDFKAKDPKVPKDEDIKRAISSVGYENVIVEDNTIRLKNKGAHLDLGGIAKGYISGKMADYLAGEGVEHGIINLGGNVVTLGEKPDGSPWNVGIQDPNDERREVVGATEAVDMAVITSGTYERKFTSGGKIYHHIIDPDTGYPVDNDIEGVTIKCPRKDAGLCDAYSTICLLKGARAGKEFIESKEGFEALFYEKSGKAVKTSGFEYEEVQED